MRGRALLISLLLIAATFGFVPPVHAVDPAPVLRHNVYNSSSSSSASATLGSGAYAIGDLEIAQVMVYGSQPPSSFTPSVWQWTGADDNGTAVNSVVGNLICNPGQEPLCTPGGNGMYWRSVATFYAVATTTAAFGVSVTVTAKPNPTVNGVLIELEDVSGMNLLSDVVYSSGSTGSYGGNGANLSSLAQHSVWVVPSIQRTTTTDWETGLVSFYMGLHNGGVAFSYSFSTGFSKLDDRGSAFVVWTGLASGITQPSPFNDTITSTPASNFYGFVETGVIFSNTPFTSTVGPCNYLQLQCWWYPSLFMMLFSGFFLMVAGVSRAPPKVAMHLFLSGLTYGSFVAVIFGIMNITLPLALLLINTFYVLRMRGR